MADTKKEEVKTTPPAGATGTERSTTEDQYSTGPAGVDEDDPNATKTYYLRPGAAHMHIVKGEPRDLNKAGQKADLTASQYEAFKDKFFTSAEYKAHQAGQEATAEGASAATLEAPLDGTTSEVSTPEEHGAANNEPTGKTNAAGEVGKPAATDGKK
jgi:hypothetical protein